MDFVNSVSSGGAFNSVWWKIRVKMTETFIVPPAILICNKIKNNLQKRIHKNVEVF